MRRIGIIATDYTTARDIAEEEGLLVGRRAWYYIQTVEDLYGRRHQEPEELFDPEYDVLCEASVWRTRKDWVALKKTMDAAGLVYKAAPSTIPPF